MKRTTWNAWDVRGINGVMKPPENAIVRIAFYEPSNGAYTEEMLWNNTVRFGDRHPLSDSFDVDFWFQDRVFRFEFAAQDDQFVLRATPLEAAPDLRFLVQGLFRWRARGDVVKQGDALELRHPDGLHRVDAVGRAANDAPEQAGPCLVFSAGAPVYVRGNHSMNLGEMEAFLADVQGRDRRGRVRGTGALKGVAQSAFKAVGWNTVWDTMAENQCTPVSRAWCSLSPDEEGSYVLFEWDTFFNSLIASLDSPELSRVQVETMLAYQREDGFLPNVGSHKKCSEQSQPQVGTHCLRKLYERLDDRTLVETHLDALLGWNRWWRTRAQGVDGLLELGTHTAPGETAQNALAAWLQRARYESGLDNSPMYDEVEFDVETMTMKLVDVGMNGLYASDSAELGELARQLGRDVEAAELSERAEHYRKAIERHLWDESRGIYANRYRDGALQTRYAPTNFYPLMAGSDPARARRMVDAHLLNPDEFWGRYPLPSISRSDPAFSDNDYWRGRIWPPQVFLVYDSLRRSGFADEASQVAAKALDLFNYEWLAKNHIHENYNANTGEGCDNPMSSNNFYSWGGLLPFIATAELADADAAGGMRFGALDPRPTGLHDVHWRGGRLSVSVAEAEPGLRIEFNGETVLTTTTPALVYLRPDAEGRPHLRVRAREAGKLTVHQDLAPIAGSMPDAPRPGAIVDYEAGG